MPNCAERFAPAAISPPTRGREASFSRVEPGAKRMENAAARMGHGESAIRDHIRGQVQVGVTKPAFDDK
jgi:hypothetical protein